MDLDDDFKVDPLDELLHYLSTIHKGLNLARPILPQTQAGNVGVPAPLVKPNLKINSSGVDYNNPNTRLYHGTERWTGLSRFDLSRARANSEPGMFMTPSKSLARDFGDRVIPLNVDTRKFPLVDLKNIAGKPLDYRNKIVSEAIDATKSVQKPGVILRNMVESNFVPHGKADQVIGVLPQNLVRHAVTGDPLFAKGGEVEPLTYTLKSGDNPSLIAKRFGLSLAQLMQLNGLDENSARKLKVGQTFILRPPQPDNPKAAGPITGPYVGRGEQPLPYLPNTPPIELPRTNAPSASNIGNGDMASSLRTIASVPAPQTIKFNPTTQTLGDASALDKAPDWKAGQEKRPPPMPKFIPIEMPPTPEPKPGKIPEQYPGQWKDFEDAKNRPQSGVLENFLDSQFGRDLRGMAESSGIVGGSAIPAGILGNIAKAYEASKIVNNTQMPNEGSQLFDKLDSIKGWLSPKGKWGMLFDKRNSPIEDVKPGATRIDELGRAEPTFASGGAMNLGNMNKMTKLANQMADARAAQPMPQAMPYVNPSAPGFGGLQQLWAGNIHPNHAPPSPDPDMAPPPVVPPVPPPQGFAQPMNPVPSYARGGMIRSYTPGRADKVPMKVKSKSYIFPADTVSALGGGNSLAGAKVLDHALKRKHKFADGGSVDIAASGGEYVASPEEVAALGNGDINNGHDICDEIVRQTRAKAIKTLQSLPGPKGTGDNKADGGEIARPIILPLTPEAQRGLKTRLKNALDYGGDEDLDKVIKHAAKFGIDWEHLR